MPVAARPPFPPPPPRPRLAAKRIVGAGGEAGSGAPAGSSGDAPAGSSGDAKAAEPPEAPRAGQSAGGSAKPDVEMLPLTAKAGAPRRPAAVDPKPESGAKGEVKAKARPAPAKAALRAGQSAGGSAAPGAKISRLDEAGVVRRALQTRMVRVQFVSLGVRHLEKLYVRRLADQDPDPLLILIKRIIRSYFGLGSFLWPEEGSRVASHGVCIYAVGSSRSRV